MFAAALFASVPLVALVIGQDVEAGRKVFESRCARCHGADGNGGEMGPPIVLRLSARDDEQLAAFIHEGSPSRGMPPNDVAGGELRDLLKFLRSIEKRPEAKPIVRTKVQTAAGVTLDGQIMAEGFDDLQLLTEDKRIHLLRQAPFGLNTTAIRAAIAIRH